ncbi:SbcC/MukB-like Walker B domain-containing protein [Cytobacillus gottheilii]|uniref:SbcC/MukB-like Walker B domain-containing protein n=1 Tax=Cytobacillus gottheilii TaxID=859144 RepID=UPI0008305EF7|nr:SMC family ATPase [Cytobacillus gottheilii]
MRPLKLTMQAFGPYAGKEEIDFTQLGLRTMFVISGKTGAGKTTIFDGISFAIYGKASGEDRNGSDLRSQFALNSIATEVSLEFSLRNKTYFISRSPQQIKKKERGDGTTTVGAKAELYIYDKDGKLQLLASNVRDVDEKIKEIMIIDSNQFRQILMIPQGEFRKLLTSDSKDKELILQRLFHTELYKRMEEVLKEEASQLKKAVEKRLDDRSHAIQQIHASFSDELKNYLDAGSTNDVVILPLLEEEISFMEAALEQLIKAGKTEQEKRNKLQQKIYEAENIVKQLETKENLQKRKIELDGLKTSVEEKEAEIALAHKAAILEQQEEICHMLKRDLDVAEQEHKQAETRFTDLSQLLQKHQELWTAEQNKEEERKIAQENVNRLKNIQEDIYSFAAVEADAMEANKNLQQLKEKRSELEERQKQIEAKLEELTAEKGKLEQNQLQFIQNEHIIEKLNNELQKLHQFKNQSDRYHEAERIHKEKEEFYTQTKRQLDDAKATQEALENTWLKGQAAVLAGKLADGEACPVCGSNHHPVPAHASGEVPTDEDLKAAKERLVKAEQQKGQAESAFYQAQSSKQAIFDTLNDLEEDIRKHSPDYQMEQLPSLFRTAKDKLQELTLTQKEFSNEKERLSLCEKQLKNGEEAKKNLQHELQSTGEKVNEATILYTEKQTELTRMTGKIPAELRSVQLYQKQLQQAENELQQMLKQLEAAQKMHQETQSKHAAEKARLELQEKNAVQIREKLKIERNLFVEKMQKQGFKVYGEYKQAKRTELQLQDLDSFIRNYREELRSVTDRISELSELLHNVEAPDLEAMRNQLKELDEQISILQEQYTALTIKKRDNTATKQKIDEINASMKELEERYQLIGHLSDISKGQNTYRITFERFVLAAFLDDILREANSRLTKMTSGRYELLRKTDRSKGNVQSGLELLIYDQYTGQERHVKTLSGGESFKASLALALGLADVVQNYAGGVSLETMFIDEGFGTLDPESLDQAIESLIDIQSSGRLVGVISHVPELKERIDARLEVTATQTGSKTQFLLKNH